MKETANMEHADIPRVAILHYTAPPVVGGIEGLISAQIEALHVLGYAPRLIVGTDAQVSGTEVLRVPLLDPCNATIADACSHLETPLPTPHDPVVKALTRDVRAALQDCAHCWVHNAFTVYLNPFLTVALDLLVRELSDVRWVAWCEDISLRSAYWASPGPWPWATSLPRTDRVRYVTISRARQQELSSTFEVPCDDIMVMPQPIDVYQWLGIGPEARQVARRLHLEVAEPIVLVPSKLVPHKRPDRAVWLASHLRRWFARPLAVVTAAPSPHQPSISEQLRRSLYQLIDELELRDTVYLLPDVLGRPPERSTVRDLMLLSDLVFLPSAEEGFGMPIQEAAALRAPVLCSDIPPFREAAGDAATFFPLDAPDESVAKMAGEITSLSVNRRRRVALRSVARFRRQLEVLLGEGE